MRILLSNDDGIEADGLKCLLNINPQLVQVCLPDILFIIDSLSTFKLNTQDIF